MSRGGRKSFSVGQAAACFQGGRARPESDIARQETLELPQRLAEALRDFNLPLTKEQRGQA